MYEKKTFIIYYIFIIFYICNRMINFLIQILPLTTNNKNLKYIMLKFKNINKRKSKLKFLYLVFKYFTLI